MRSSYSNTHFRLKHACRRGFRRLMEPRDPSITTLSCPHARRCARHARELSSFCTTLTTTGKHFDFTSSRKIPGCPHSIQHISLVVKVGKLINLQTVGEILQSSRRVHLSRLTQSAGIKPPSVSCDFSLSCVSHQQTTLSYMSRRRRYHVWGVAALSCCAELCSGHPRPSR